MKADPFPIQGALSESTLRGNAQHAGKLHFSETAVQRCGTSMSEPQNRRLCIVLHLVGLVLHEGRLVFHAGRTVRVRAARKCTARSKAAFLRNSGAALWNFDVRAPEP